MAGSGPGGGVDLEQLFADAPWVGAELPGPKRGRRFVGFGLAGALVVTSVAWGLTRPAGGATQVMVTVSPSVVVSTTLVTVSPTASPSATPADSTTAAAPTGSAPEAPATTVVVVRATTAAPKTTAVAPPPAPKTTQAPVSVSAPTVTGFSCTRNGSSFSASASFAMHGAGGTAVIKIGPYTNSQAVSAASVSSWASASLTATAQSCSVTVTNSAGSDSTSTTTG